METRIRHYSGTLNGKERFYYVYGKDRINAFFYEEWGTNHHYAPLVMYYDQKVIPVRRPASQVSEQQAMKVVFDHLVEMVKSGYSGKTNKDDQVTRNQSINIFNPIKEVEIEGKLYLVEWHSRAGYMNIRRARKYAEKKYTTREWAYDIRKEKYEYLGEMA